MPICTPNDEEVDMTIDLSLLIQFSCQGGGIGHHWSLIKSFQRTAHLQPLSLKLLCHNDSWNFALEILGNEGLLKNGPAKDWVLKNGPEIFVLGLPSQICGNQTSQFSKLQDLGCIQG